MWWRKEAANEKSSCKKATSSRLNLLFCTSPLPFILGVKFALSPDYFVLMRYFVYMYSNLFTAFRKKARGEDGIV